MSLSEELIWRGFLEQTTYKDPEQIDEGSITFYWGVDPSADSMTIGNLALAILARHFIKAGHKAVLLVGGATGLIGDPDGKSTERDLINPELLEANKKAIVAQYQKLFAGEQFDLVDNYDWFKGLDYLTFLREVGKHVPLRQMLSREFITTRLGEEGSGISYAEFSYCLIQGYDFLVLNKNKGVNLQIAGSDQWGNSIAGVDLVRRISGNSVDVWTAPLIVDKTTGKKFGKSESGAVWLDPNKTTPTAFYQFWINLSDSGVEEYLKIYTFLSKEEIEKLLADHQADPKKRLAQKTLAKEVTTLVHGQAKALLAEAVTSYLTNDRNVSEATAEELEAIRNELPSIKLDQDSNLINILVKGGLAQSNTEAKSLIDAKAIYANNQPLTNLDALAKANATIVRRGKAFKDSMLVEK